MMKLLVLTSEPITAEQLRQAFPAELEADQTEVAVVAPAFQASPLKFWTGDADDAIERAKEVWSRSVQTLEAEGISAQGDTGESDPLQAIQDTLQTFPADRILVFTHAEDAEQRYREDIDPDEVRERFGLPVDRAPV